MRFGNDMGSRGSVMMFRELIDEGLPIMIAVPRMTRFLLTLDEEIDLVVYAEMNARGGAILVRTTQSGGHSAGREDPRSVRERVRDRALHAERLVVDELHRVPGAVDPDRPYARGRTRVREHRAEH